MQERHVLADALLAKHDPAGPTPRGPLPRWIEPTRPTYGECSNLRYAPEAGLYWSLDFNVDPMTAVIAQHLKGRLSRTGGDLSAQRKHPSGLSGGQ
jgi:hypothetical protein